MIASGLPARDSSDHGVFLHKLLLMLTVGEFLLGVPIRLLLYVGIHSLKLSWLSSLTSRARTASKNDGRTSFNSNK